MHSCKRVLTRMTERRVPKIVRERDGFGQIFIQAQVACHGAPICATSSECVSRVRKQIAFMIDEHLRLVLQPSKSRRMNDAIAIALELTAGDRIGLRVTTTTRPIGVRCKRS